MGKVIASFAPAIPNLIEGFIRSGRYRGGIITGLVEAFTGKAVAPPN